MAQVINVCRRQTPAQRVYARRCIDWRIMMMDHRLPDAEAAVFSRWLLWATDRPVPDIEHVFRYFEIPIPTAGQLSRIV